LLNSEEAGRSPVEAHTKQDHLVGEVFADRYEIISLIGTGGMSVVYKARHMLMKNLVAVKMLLPHMLSSPTSVKRFQQEAQAASALSHPNLITVHDLGVTPDGIPYLVMEYVEGYGLSDLIKREGRVSPARCLDILIDACDALAVAHDKGIIHRDLKPSNIMIAVSGDGGEQVKIVDFGIAKLLPTEGEEAQQLTQTGELFGSPLYMSPEQCLSRPLDARSDVYSLGCLMYEALAGSPPLAGGSIIETMYKHMHELPSGLGAAVPDTSLRQQLEAVVFKAMAKEPEQRFQSMREFKTALERVRAGAGRGLLGRMKSLWEVSRLKRVPRRARSTLILALGALVIVLGLISAWALNTLFGSPAEKKYVPMSLTRIEEPAPPLPADHVRTEKLVELILNLARKKDAAEPLVPRLTRFGQYYKRYHRWANAAVCFESALRIARAIGSTDNIDYYNTEIDLADCYYELKRYSDAEPLYRQAVDRLDRVTGEEDIWEPAAKLGDIYLRQGAVPEAEKRLAWSVRVQRRGHSQGAGLDKAPGFALTLSKLADAYRLQGKLDRAEETYLSAMEAWRQIEGESAQKNLAICLYYLADVQRLEGKLDQSARNLKQAVHVAQAAYGSEDPYVANMLYKYADVLWARHDWIQGMQAWIRANTIWSKASSL
jgi:tetratricopeptide (TPR) repeat protein/tRNA A-37 threonylcarbamoyl transferase component Bud32